MLFLRRYRVTTSILLVSGGVQRHQRLRSTSRDDELRAASANSRRSSSTFSAASANCKPQTRPYPPNHTQSSQWHSRGKPPVLRTLALSRSRLMAIGFVTNASSSYNRYIAVASRVVRRSLKEDKRIAAERRGESELRFAKWEVSVYSGSGTGYCWIRHG